MIAATIEQRIEALEREVRLLRAAVKRKGKKEKPWWERFGGTFKDNPLFDEMVTAGQGYAGHCDHDPNDPDSRHRLLLSRNLRDFSRVPNLRVEDWTR